MFETIAENYRPDWRTPKAVVTLVQNIYGGTIKTDPCASQDPGYHFASTNLTTQGLEFPWDGTCYINPPYGRPISKWVEYGSSQSCPQIWLVPARVDTRWWRKLMSYTAIFAIKDGRLKFDDGKNPAPFPSALVCTEHYKAQFIELVSQNGWTFYVQEHCQLPRS